MDSGIDDERGMGGWTYGRVDGGMKGGMEGWMVQV